jgi:hypothetical protein
MIRLELQRIKEFGSNFSVTVSTLQFSYFEIDQSRQLVPLLRWRGSRRPTFHSPLHINHAILN